MIGSRLTTSTLEAAPGEPFANTATLKSEHLLQQSARLHSSVVSCRTSSWQMRTELNWRDVNTRCRRRPALRSSILQLRQGLQSCACSEPLQCHLDIQRSLLERTGRLRPIHASASEGIELRDRRRCKKLAPWERVIMTYVIQLPVAHALPLR